LERLFKILSLPKLGGEAANVVPEYAEASLMFRIVSDTEEIFEQVKKIVGNRVVIEKGTANNPVQLSILEGFEPGIVAFNTDIPYFQFGPDAKAFLFGPGCIRDAHTEREFIFIEELKKSIETYQQLAKKLLQSSQL